MDGCNGWDGLDGWDGNHVETTWQPCGAHVETTWKPCGAHVETTWKPCGGHVQTMCKPFGNRMKTMWGPCGNHMKTMWGTCANMCKPCANHVETTWKPCGGHVQTMYKPHENHVGDMCKPCANHVQTMCKSCANHVQSIWKPHENHVGRQCPGGPKSQKSQDETRAAKLNLASLPTHGTIFVIEIHNTPAGFACFAQTHVSASICLVHIPINVLGSGMDGWIAMGGMDWMDGMETIWKPHDNHVGDMCKLCAIHVQTMCEPCAIHMETTWESYGGSVLVVPNPKSQDQTRASRWNLAGLPRHGHQRMPLAGGTLFVFKNVFYTCIFSIPSIQSIHPIHPKTLVNKISRY